MRSASRIEVHTHTRKQGELENTITVYGGKNMAVKDVSNQTIAELISLKGSMAVVTGGAQGIGAAIAHRLAEAGAEVMLGDLNADAAKKTADSLTNQGYVVWAAEVDVTDPSSVSRLADQAVERGGELNIWVNNAGIFPTDDVLKMPLVQWQRVIEVNLTGTYVGAREAGNRMVAQGKGGVVINLASVQSYRAGGPGFAHYVSAKHGISGLTKSLAIELGPHNIRVLALAPTLIATPGTQVGKKELAKAMNTTEDPWETVAKQYLALGRTGVPDDIARVALFCASDMSMFMTGSTLPVDAGYLAL